MNLPTVMRDEVLSMILMSEIGRWKALTGDKQTTLVPDALKVSQDDITMRPVIDCRSMEYSTEIWARNVENITYSDQFPDDPWGGLLFLCVRNR